MLGKVSILLRNKSISKKVRNSFYQFYSHFSSSFYYYYEHDAPPKVRALCGGTYRTPQW